MSTAWNLELIGAELRNAQGSAETASNELEAVLLGFEGALDEDEETFDLAEELRDVAEHRQAKQPLFDEAD